MKFRYCLLKNLPSNSALSQVNTTSVSLRLIEICTNKLDVPNGLSPFIYQIKNCLLFPNPPYALNSPGHTMFSLARSGKFTHYRLYVAKIIVKISACELQYTLPILCITRYHNLICRKVTFLEFVIKCNIIFCEGYISCIWEIFRNFWDLH
jgi:hypothetical protein